MARIFAFEGENNQTLEWMPLDVRRKLDLAGLKVSLAAWQKMPLADRSALVVASIDTENDVAPFRALTEKLVRGAGAELTDIPRVPFGARPWNSDAVRDAVAKRASELGVTPNLARWNALDDCARYALRRLSEPTKKEDKLKAALTELGLL